MALQRRAVETMHRHFLRSVARVVVLVVGDLGASLVAWGALRAIRDDAVLGAGIAELLAWAAPRGGLAGWQFAAAMLVGLTVAGAYRPGDCRRDPRRLFAAMALAGGLVLWRELWVRDPVSVVMHYATAVIGMGVTLVVTRLVIDRFVARGTPSERLLFVGNPRSPTSMGIDAKLARSEHMASLGWVTVASGNGSGPTVRGTVDDLGRILLETRADTVVLCGTVPIRAFDLVVDATAAAGCRLLAVTRYEGVEGLRAKFVWYHRLPFVELSVPSLRGRQLFLKRTIDLIGAGMGLVLLSPLFALIAIGIKLEAHGPVFFSQERVGMGGKIFRLLKFRTMRVGADEQKRDVAHLNQTGDPRLFKIPNDPRVTRVGAWLRRWSLDELPQLWNVFRGEMSLVGPRPFFEADLESYSDHHFGRLGAKPGITGLWQVNGRSSVVDFEEVVRLDHTYIDGWSLWLDVKILLRTLPAVMRKTGAY